jgi:3-hydroxyisobutyrate dehydrogenase-like beta-hydroxyacid dehydrogenase
MPAKKVQMSHVASGQAITVIGLGAMGTALAKAFLANNHQVTISNRSAHKSAPLVEAGALVDARVHSFYRRHI